MRYTIPLAIELDAESHAEAVAEVNEWLDLACGLITRQDFHRYAVTAEDTPDLDAPHILPEDFAV